MEWVPVTSSTISRIRWDPQSLILEIEFHNGRIYQYFDVPEAVFQALRNAPSVGTYFSQNVKGAFRFART